MSRLFKGSVFVLLFFWAVLLPGMSSAQQSLPNAEDSVPVLTTDEDLQAFWTPERLAEAVPLEVEAVEPASATRTDFEAPPMPPPVLEPGWEGKGPLPDESQTMYLDADLNTRPPFSPPANPVDYDNYGPFQRFNFPGNYLRYPRSTVGKLMFYMDTNGDGIGEGPYYCTASVIEMNTLATAAHCVNSGLNGAGFNRGFSYNEVFIPSYDVGIEYVGRWAADGPSIVSLQWYQRGNPRGLDRDYACLVTRPYGSRYSTPVANITGFTGRAYNFSPSYQMVMWGYPAEYPFNGSKIINTIAPEWYEADMGADGAPYSKYIGNDQNRGCSGGPWWFNYVHPALNYPDTDGNNHTNPGQGSSRPFINGVNSHKRCRGSCFTPPTSTAGTYWQEEGSPQFTQGRYGDGDEAYDIFEWCFANGGS